MRNKPLKGILKSAGQSPIQYSWGTGYSQANHNPHSPGDFPMAFSAQHSATVMAAAAGITISKSKRIKDTMKKAREKAYKTRK